MDSICPKCGLPKELCTCETIAKEREIIKISHQKKRYGKDITVISGMAEGVDKKRLLKKLKRKLACGGTIKDNSIELQGNHIKRAKKFLVSIGFPENQIKVS